MFTTLAAIKTQSTQPEDIVERLQTEKKVLLKKIRQEGFELGIRSTSTLSHKEFQHFEHVYPISVALDAEALDYLWMFLDAHGYSQETRIYDADFEHLLEISPESRVAFTQGWLDGVLSVWNTIKCRVNY